MKEPTKKQKIEIVTDIAYDHALEILSGDSSISLDRVISFVTFDFPEALPDIIRERLSFQFHNPRENLL